MPPRTKKAAAPSAVSDIAALVNKVYPGAMTTGSDPDLAVTRIPVGIAPLDDLLDGGIPRGRHVEVYGPYSTLKSYYAYKALAAYQKRGLKVCLVDTEHSFDPEWGEQLGIDTKRLEIVRPTTAEVAFGVMQALVTAGYDLIVFDSIAAAQPKQYAEAAPGDDDAPAALARVMSRGLRRITTINKHTSIIWINQQRATIGITFGPKSATSGGLAMGYYASYRLSFRRSGKITQPTQKWDGEKMIDAQKVVAHKIQATLEKSKLSAPYSDCHFTFDLTTGSVDETGWVVGTAMERGIIQNPSKGYWTIEGVLDKPIHGKDNFRAWVDENAEEVVPWLKEALTSN